MYRKIVWCYLIVLALLDISHNTKLSAQGKSHGNGVSVHEPLMEGISLQEWGKESEGEGGVGRGRAAPPGAVQLAPAALHFGRAALAAAHARTVTLTNTANETLHLASVAGSTPDFHASFFESKSLLPQANTTFSVVYLGRREGPVSTHLYIHTSKGVLKYPVSAEGVASAWRVWPLLGVRVPLNATLEPTLELHNPTDTTIQVKEVYSSAKWLGLRLPDGGESAPRGLWSLPPHSTRPLVRLRLRPAAALHAPAHAYIRIQGSMPGGAPVALVVGVETWAAPPSEFLAPLQLRLRPRGTRDPPDTFSLEAGNSEETVAALDAEVWGATCAPAPPDPPPPPARPPANHKPVLNGARAEAGGVRVALLRDRLGARQALAPAARLTLDYAAMWAGGDKASEREARSEAWCAGWVRVGRAHAPYSVRLLPGTLTLTPNALHFVTANKEEVYKEREVHAYNEFPVPVRIDHVEFPPEVTELFHTESLTPLVVRSGAGALAARLRLRRGCRAATLRATVTLLTNLTDYTLPLLLYEGKLHIEWDWEHIGPDGSLELGYMTLGSSRRVSARLHNRSPVPLCVSALHVSLPGATVQLANQQQRCVEGGESAEAWLHVAAGARAGALAGALTVRTPLGESGAGVALTAHAGRLAVPPVSLSGVAPHVWRRAPLAVESSLGVRTRVTRLVASDPALHYVAESDEREVGAGRSEVGALLYKAEANCDPNCYTGLDIHSPEGAAWLSRGEADVEECAEADAALLEARLAQFRGVSALGNVSVLVHTAHVLAAPAAVAVRWAWPALAAPPAPAPAALAGAAPLRVRVANPAARPLLLQARLARRARASEPPRVWAPRSFGVASWRAVRGRADSWPPGDPDSTYVLMQKDAQIDITINFTPLQAAELAGYLYLRNNLTITEGVPLSGRGAVPSFELCGRRPNSTEPIILEVTECGAEGAGTVRRSVTVRNTGAVSVRLRDWTVGGAPCLARGFRLQPCGAFTLAPNESRVLSLAYSADWTRARAGATLAVRAGGSRAEFALGGVAAARLCARCAPLAPRAPFDGALRGVGGALALLALGVAVALAALDAERALRRHRAARPAAPAPRPPLDLRALAPPPAPSAPVPAPAPRRRRSARARGATLDAAAERRAFERWRAEVSRRAEDSRSSEEGGADPPPPPRPPPPPPPLAAPRGDASTSSPDSSPTPRDSYATSRSHGAEDEEGASTGSESSVGSERSERSDRSGRSERSGHSERDDESPPRAPALSDAPHADADPEDTPTRDVTRGASPRDESGSTPVSERKREPAAGGGAGGAGGARARGAGRRAERAARRRARGASPPAARAAPPAPRAAPAPALRWGASWSSVVSRTAPAPPHNGACGGGAAAPLAPIGSDVRRRAPSHSLFYYGAAPRCEPPRDAAPPAPAPAPAPDPAPPTHGWRAPSFPASVTPPHPDYLEERHTPTGYRSLESVWGASVEPHPAAAAWLWGGAGSGGAVTGAGAPGAGAGVPPPPGFARPYDPFHSLASIWTPAALDWRRRDSASNGNGNGTRTPADD